MDRRKLGRYLGIVAVVAVLMAIIVTIFFLFDCEYTFADVSGFGQDISEGGNKDGSYGDAGHGGEGETFGDDDENFGADGRGRFWPLDESGDVMTDAYDTVYTPVYTESDGGDGTDRGITSYSVTAVGDGVEDLVIPGEIYGVPVSVADGLMGDVKAKVDDIEVRSSNKTLRSLTIEEGVTSIGKCAFAGCEALETVVIADTVTEIGDYAFSGDTGMKCLTLSESLVDIGIWAFYKCAFETVEFPDSLVSMGNYSFHSCNNLSSVEIPSSVVTINKGAFRSCKSLESVLIRGNVESGTSVGSHVFNGCSNLAFVTFEGHISYIGQYAFGSCTSLEYIIILGTVDRIEQFAFYICSALESVYFCGTEDGWKDIMDATDNFSGHNSYFVNSTVYFYSEEEPADEGDFWHWDDNFTPATWTK